MTFYPFLQVGEYPGKSRGACNYWAVPLLGVLLAAMTACTTVQRVSQIRPVMKSDSLSNPASEQRIADSAMQSGDIQLATTLYGRIVQADPKSVPGLTGLGDTLYAVGDMTRAGVYYDRASSLDPRSIPALIGSGRVAIQQRRFDDAIGNYRKVLALVPNYPLASAGLGAALDMKGDHAGAQAVLREALKANPGDPGISVNLGLSLVMAGNARDGANVLLDITRFPAAPPQAFHDLALAYGMLGNTDAASSILSRDLPKASVDDNLHFYQIQRSRVQAAVSSVAPQRTDVPAAQAAEVNSTVAQTTFGSRSVLVQGRLTSGPSVLIPAAPTAGAAAALQ